VPNLSWNTIVDNARIFSRDWAVATREQADKQSFWNEFFLIFGIPRRTVASFEEPVRRLRGTYGFIDLLWKGKVLVEHKTAGASREAAETQAFDYLQDLQTVGRGDEIPRYVLLSDFQRFALYDLEPDEQLNLPLFRARFRYHRVEFPLADLHLHVREFAFIPGYQLPSSKPQDDLNLKAVGLMAGVHDTLRLGGYTGHDLERFLVRVLFCLFADKTGIFEPDAFRLFIENRTAADGSNLGAQLNELFATLDKPEDRRQRNLDEDLRAFPYVNGALFAERLDAAAFNGPMRKALLNACDFKWNQISPAIFGALFQEVINTDEDPKRRRKIGAHYTSERDILKVIHPLFLDKLRAEFDSIVKDRSGRRSGRLEDFRKRLTQLKFLDPACGCGNFLVIAYRELRKLELEVLEALHTTQQAFTLDEVNRLSQVDVHQFYGIEIEEWPARIAEVALWLTDHQANLRILDAFSQPFRRLPLKHSPHIHIGNALRMDWNDLLPAQECSYVMGNPPFIGKSLMSDAQKADMQHVLKQCKELKGGGVLDYVTAWYLQAAQYIDGTPLELAFVSTNSISQGEQPGILWSYLFRNYRLVMNFAYQTFPWTSEARGRAHVHVVIIGFSQLMRVERLLFSFTDKDPKTAFSSNVTNINPYLIDGPNITVLSRSRPVSSVPECMYGSKPADEGHLLLSESERDQLLAIEPGAAEFIRPLLAADQLLNALPRWCLWLVDASPRKLRDLPLVRGRVDAVRTFRAASKKRPTRDRAAYPSLFAEIRQPLSNYICVPLHTSENRRYIPLGYFPPSAIVHNSCSAIPNATLYHFGVLTSAMHMAWVRLVAGRLKSDFRYSNTLVYNNYPWPQSPTEAQRAAVEREAQSVLDARTLYPESNLATLYDPVLMPPELVKAHTRLDAAVERCYRPEPFASDRERVEFLFALYEKLTAPLLPALKTPARTRRRASAKA